MTGNSGTGDGRVLTLGVGSERFTVPAAIVREVTRLPRLSRVPHAPPVLAGLANIRGAVVPVLSLAALVDGATGHERRVVVVDIGEVIGLAVDMATNRVEGGAAGTARALDLPAMVARGMPTRRANAGHRAAPGAEAETVDRAQRVPLLVFAIGAQEFAFPLGNVDEVLRVPDGISVVPFADAAVVGSAAVRDALLPLLSLAALLALAGGADRRGARVLVVRLGTHRVGLVVDAVRAIVHVAEDEVDPVPPVLRRGGGEARIQAIARLEHGRRLVSVLAADQLVRDDLFVRLSQEIEERPDMASATGEEASEQFVLFRIGEERFGLPIGAVEEIALLPDRLTRVPRAPAFVAGIMNLRGTAVPVIDQALRFGRPATAGRRRRAIVVRIGDLVAGFAVDEVLELARVPSHALRPAPDLGTAETRVFDRIAQLDGEEQLVLIVSPRDLIDRAEQDLLHAFAAETATAPS